MKSLFNAKCDACETLKPRCAVVSVRGTNAYGDRERRIQTLCSECRKRIRGLYRVHPKHK